MKLLKYAGVVELCPFPVAYMPAMVCKYADIRINVFYEKRCGLTPVNPPLTSSDAPDPITCHALSCVPSPKFPEGSTSARAYANSYVEALMARTRRFTALILLANGPIRFSVENLSLIPSGDASASTVRRRMNFCIVVFPFDSVELSGMTITPKSKCCARCMNSVNPASSFSVLEFVRSGSNLKPTVSENSRASWRRPMKVAVSFAASGPVRFWALPHNNRLSGCSGGALVMFEETR